jgi:hypothetical protein
MNAESKIKDHVAFFKNMQRDKSNAKMFDKEPLLIFKEKPKKTLKQTGRY